MGIGFQVGNKPVGANWAYSGFHQFRKRLAKTIGIELNEMEGFGNPLVSFLRDFPNLVDVVEGRVVLPTKEELEKASEKHKEEYAATRGSIPWATVHDPIVPLLHHSDCDGELTPEQCAVIAPRLRELVSGWEDEWTAGIENYDKVNALKLADGMDQAVELNKPLIFC
jgi:hypothetical protein